MTPFTVVLMRSDECGISDLVGRRWSWTVTSKQFTPLRFPLMGKAFHHSSTFFSDGRRIPYRYQIATGSGDDTIRIWDMRSLKALYTIPAHLSNVSDVRFFYGDALPPAFSADVEMNGADDADKSSDSEKTLEEWKYRSGLYFVSGGYDGLVKLWSADDWQLLRTLPTDGGKVMSVDLSHDGKMLASGTYNRNFQIFTPDGS